MLKPSMNEILPPDQDYYSFVVSLAKRAREIAVSAEEEHEILEDKPVQLAVEEFCRGKGRVVFRRRTANRPFETLL